MSFSKCFLPLLKTKRLVFLVLDAHTDTLPRLGMNPGTASPAEGRDGSRFVCYHGAQADLEKMLRLIPATLNPAGETYSYIHMFIENLAAKAR